MKHKPGILVAFIAAIMFVTAPAIIGQTVQQTEPDSAPPPQRRLGGDPIRQLNLSPEQLAQIRTIREQNQKERAAITERVRETSRALEAVLDADSPDESIVEQRMHEASAAQAAAMRMRILTEVRIRKVLTAEQRTLLRNLRQQASQTRRERPLRNLEERLKRREDQRGLQNQQNGIRPFFPRRDASRRSRPIEQQ